MANRWETVANFIFLGSKITADGDCSHEIKRRLLLAAQGTLKSLLQHHSSKASILWCGAFFTVQLSHSYMTTGKTIALTRWTFVGKVMSLLFIRLSQFSSVTQSCPTLCDPMNSSTSGLPAHHQLSEFTQTHVHMLSRLVITFLPRSKRLLISWLQSPSAMSLEPQKIKSATVSHLFAMKWWDRMP